MHPLIPLSRGAYGLSIMYFSNNMPTIWMAWYAAVESEGDLTERIRDLF